MQFTYNLDSVLINIEASTLLTVKKNIINHTNTVIAIIINAGFMTHFHVGNFNNNNDACSIYKTTNYLIT